MTGKKLASPVETAAALERIEAWRRSPADTVACPLCGAPGLEIVDRSARPHAEWYHVACASCGLDDNINVPLSSA